MSDFWLGVIVFVLVALPFVLCILWYHFDPDAGVFYTSTSVETHRVTSDAIDDDDSRPIGAKSSQGDDHD